MSNYNFTHDPETTERISAQRDDIYEWAVDRFRYHMSNDDMENAMCIADEFFEWMDPNQLESEDTLFANYDQLRE